MEEKKELKKSDLEKVNGGLKKAPLKTGSPSEPDPAIKPVVPRTTETERVIRPTPLDPKIPAETETI